MNATIGIRPETLEDIETIHAVNRNAFKSNAEPELVDQLRECDSYIPELSLVAVADCGIIGHLLMTKATVVPSTEVCSAVAMGPVAVLPEWQRRGIGSMLVRRSLTDAAGLGFELVIVLGHPEYYPRFGFTPASHHGIRCPFKAPDEVFMAMWIGGSQPRQLNGVARYAAPFEAMESE